MELGPQVSVVKDDFDSIPCHRLTGALICGDDTASLRLCFD